MAEIKYDTHIVIKRADAEKYLAKHGQMQLEALLAAISIGREQDGKPAENSYYVCNTDEPYADWILQAILDGEAGKEEAE